MTTVPPATSSLLNRTSFSQHHGSRSTRFALFGLLAVLMGLPAFALWGATVTYETGVAVRHATHLSDLFEHARFTIATEESLERKYRLHPGEAVRANHHSAATDLIVTLDQADILSDLADRELVEAVSVLHTQYLEVVGRMFAAVDANDLAEVTRLDQTEADPVFDNIVDWVNRAAERNRMRAADNLESLAAIQWKVLVATPIVFTIGAALVFFFWKMLRRYQRQVETNLVQIASATRTSEQRFRGLVQNTADMILICGAEGRVTYQSPAAESTWSYPATGLLGETVMSMVHQDDKPALRDFWEQLVQVAAENVEGASRTIELQLINGKAVWRHVQLIGTNLLHDAAVQGIVVTVRDITERKTFEQQLTKQAFYDALTGLPNRVLFRDRLEQALVRAGRRQGAVGVLFLDLDSFKLINDSLGHQIGDELLIGASARLRSCVRAQDTVARLGGDEFVVILELLTSPEDAKVVAEIITKQFSRPFMLSGREVVVPASIGIALSEVGQEHAESMLRDADVAMYRAKSEGGARYVLFDPSMHKDSMARLELENDLRHALERDELRVHYQPIVILNSGRFAEVEALVRWQHPTRGMIQPGDFIPIAEETGMIIPLGQWVLEEACRQVAGWHKQFSDHPPLVLSVNLSPRQFQQPSLVADVARVLADTGLPANCLKLEITESVIMRDVESTIRTLWELKDLGLQLAIDDFGTGYSSLSYLKRLPLDILKIDRSFIQGIGSSQEDTAIVHAIMALAKSLNLKVTGEGIETTEQASLLEKWQCDRGQGYLFSRPLDGATASEFLEAEAQRTTVSVAV